MIEPRRRRSVPVFDWEKVEARTIIPGFKGRFIHSETMTFVLWRISAGARLPEHRHIHEQVVHQLEGAFELTIEGRTVSSRRGMVTAIPPNALHSGHALTDCRILDVFYPIRDDYRFEGAPAVLSDALEAETGGSAARTATTPPIRPFNSK
jgi:quercetin dioxygenase-like cupin family protein